MAELDYIRTDEPQVHGRRRKEILERHPEVREITGAQPVTLLAILLLVPGQIALAVWASTLPVWAVLVLAYVVGAVVSHALFVMIHETAHNLVLKGTKASKVLGIVADLPQVFPSAIMFRKYHLLHHRYMGELDMDADIADPKEARLVGNSWWRKALWMLLFAVSQAFRPLKVKSVPMWDAWSVVNVVAVFAVNVLVAVLVSPVALLYLALSTVFAVGLHPLGGRWIQEHYVTVPGQETYSYYGAGNLLAFNVGYHTEHHDFMTVSWRNLPRLRRLAPEFYDHQRSYRSWTAVLLHFIFSPRMSPFTRITHPSTVR